MSRSGINKQQVIAAAKEIASQQQIPTAIKIRELLSTGSIATIQKYLRAWKTECFKIDLGGNLNSLNNTNQLENQFSQWLEEKNQLEGSLNKQITKNESYAQELIEAEKTIVALKEENNKLQTNNQKLQLELQEANAIKATLTQVNQEIQSRLERNDNQTIIQQKQLIVELQAELKELNAKSIKAIQELSSSGHEVLMQEKVTNINLQAKIDSLQKELIESKKQLQEATLTSQVQIRSLARQNEELQKIIQDHDLYKRSSIDQESKLRFNIENEEATHGK